MNIPEIQTWVDIRIDELLAATGVAKLPDIIQELIEKLKIPPAWEGGTEAREVLYEGYRTIVGSVNRKRKKQEESPDADRQLVLAGFKRLQRSYSIQRNGEDIIVASTKMTRAEWGTKRAQLAAMKNGLGEHIEEIDKYVMQTWPDQQLERASQ